MCLNNQKKYTNCLDGTIDFLSQQKAYSFLHLFTINICCLNSDCSAKQEIAFPILAKEYGSSSNTDLLTKLLCYRFIEELHIVCFLHGFMCCS